MHIQTILDFVITYQDHARTTTLKAITVGESLNFIKYGKFANEVSILREYISKDCLNLYKINKTRLPAVTFSASFNQTRNRSLISEYNKLLVIDIDNLSPDQMISLKGRLILDNHILALWESPSKSGLKGLILLDYESSFKDRDLNASHTLAFKKISIYFHDTHNIKLDASGSDITRLCFFSHDENLFLRDSVTPYYVSYSEDEFKEASVKVIRENVGNDSKYSKNKLFNPLNKNKPLDREIINSIIRFLKKGNKTITRDYNNWFQIAMAISTTFSYELGSKIFHNLSKMDSDKYVEDDCDDLLKYCYHYSDGSYTFGTVMHFAHEVGFKKRKEVPKVEIV